MKINFDDLEEQGLVKYKKYDSGIYSGLKVIKYARQVFYNNLWNADDRLLQARGIVTDEEDNVIVRPFDKIFNIHENGTEIDPETDICAEYKYNGFLGVATRTEKYGIIYSTTGSLDSDFAVMVKNHLQKYENVFSLGSSYMFEICDENDQHFIEESFGEYIIGIRDIETGYLMSPTDYRCITTLPRTMYDRNKLTNESPLFFPVNSESFVGKFKDLPMHRIQEGWVIYDEKGFTGNNPLAKYKTPYYNTKKALSRLNKKRFNSLFNNTEVFKQSIDEEYYPLIDFIVQNFTLEEFKELSEADRKKIFDKFFEENL